MIEATPAETRQHYRDRGNMLPSDYELEQQYGNATIGAARWLGRESEVDKMPEIVREIVACISKSVDNK